jgi:hypothetical protein
MPPKKRKAPGSGTGPAKRSSGKAAASSSQQLAEDEEHQLLDLDGGGVGTRRRQLGRRDSDETVERSITKHFSGFSQIDLETQKVNNQTLRERIREDRQKLERSGRLGSTYWRDLVQEWSGISSIGSLRPTTKDYWVLKCK